MSYSKTIYKKDTKGKTRFLHVYTEDADLVQESGVVGSENTIEHRSTCTGKHVGKSNETTPEEQAELEAASKIETKMSTGYFATVEETESEVVILPMLAKDYKKESKKVQFPCYAQPKLDGMRALGNTDYMKSRTGKEIDTVNHIHEEIKDLGIRGDILDGELYAHGYTFQQNMKALKKFRAESVDGAPKTEDVKYHVYDIVMNLPFSERTALLAQFVAGAKHIEFVPTYIINNEAELKIAHARFIEEGYEGTIVRWGDAPYKVNGRSSNLLKYKDFQDIQLEIKDIRPSDRNPSHGFPVFHWPGAKNDELKAGVKMSHTDRELFLQRKEKFIGDTVELRFFEYSDTGVPRFPVMVGYRLDK